jgi:hypothetical protein
MMSYVSVECLYLNVGNTDKEVVLGVVTMISGVRVSRGFGLG